MGIADRIVEANVRGWKRETLADDEYLCHVEGQDPARAELVMFVRTYEQAAREHITETLWHRMGEPETVTVIVRSKEKTARIVVEVEPVSSISKATRSIEVVVEEQEGGRAR
jgi:hypothetical protein